MLKRVLKWVAALFFAIAVVSFSNAFLAYHVSRFPGVQFGKYYEYSGVVNVHTTYSDGSAGYEDIGRLCDAMGIHFAIITDVNTVQPILDSLDARWGMTLIIPAVEISANSGAERYLVVGDSVPHLPDSGRSLSAVLQDASRKGDIVVLAHSMQNGPGIHAQNNEAVTFNGIEFYNFDSGWKEMLNVFGINKLLGAYFAYSIDPSSLNYVLQYPSRRMEDFDRLNRSRRIVGLGTLGARSNIDMGGRNRWHFPSYESMFNLVHTVIVTRTPYNALYRHDRELTLNAIRNGNMYVAFSGLEEARGFLFTATSGNTEAIMGDSLRLQAGTTIGISLPDSTGVETQVVKDGKVIAVYRNAGSISMAVDMPGVYRVQVFQKRTMLPFFMKRLYPWILSNPIYIYKN